MVVLSGSKIERKACLDDMGYDRRRVDMFNLSNYWKNYSSRNISSA